MSIPWSSAISSRPPWWGPVPAVFRRDGHYRLLTRRHNESGVALALADLRARAHKSSTTRRACTRTPSRVPTRDSPFHSCPDSAVRVHRLSARQPRDARPVQGLSSSRARSCVPSVSLHRNSPSAIVGVEKRRPGRRCRGNTVITASHARHRKRRTRMTLTHGTPPGAAGPRTCLSRTPWPMSASLLPGSRDATPQRGQALGLHRWMSGASCSENLTSGAA